MRSLVLLFISLLSTSVVQAQTQVPNTFQAGQPARAADVNANFDALETAVDSNATAISANSGTIDSNSSAIENNAIAIQANAVSIQALDNSIFASEIQTATDYGRRGASSGGASLRIIEQLVRTLGLTCAEANYGRFIGCTQLTSGDGTIWPIVTTISEYAVAYIQVEGVPTIPGMFTPFVLAAQISSGGGEVLLGGTANFLRWTYRDADDVGRLVDDCDSPTVAMSPPSLGGTSSRWRVNNGAYYYVPLDSTSGSVVPTGEIDVAGQTVGIINNINPNAVSNVGSVVWCEMSDQVTGLYNTYELRPYPFNLNEARFSQPFTVN